jgi:alpha-maltose-1-phosphate synthase
MKALLVHPGTQHAFQLARQLERHQSLGRFWTGFAYDPKGLVGRQIAFLPAWAQRRFAGRRLAGLPPEKLRTRPLTDLRAMNRLRLGEDEQRVMFDRNAHFQRRVPESELAASDVVIGFDTASWLIADKAHSQGRNFVLDRTTGHPLSFEHLFPQLNRQFPQWIENCSHRLPEVRAAEDVEHDRARRIVVGSSFTRRTLVENGVPAEKIAVVPLGVDLLAFTPKPQRDLSRPLRFVFVGRLRAPKGVPLLLQVWRSLGNSHAELWLVGSPNARHPPLIPPLPGLRVLGNVSRRELPRVLRQCDVLAFPSYFEGFGAVLLEAMAAGLPVIATDSTGAPDVMTSGVEGYVIPTGNAAALKDAMHRFIDCPERLAPMSVAARHAAERHSWDQFGNRWMEILQQVCDSGQAVRSPAGANARNAAAEVQLNVPVRPEKRVLLIHPGTQYSFRLAGQLEKHGCLNRFWTGMAYIPDTLLGRCIQRLPEGVKRQLSNRRLEDVPPNKICIRPLGEWWAVHRLRAGEDDQTIMFKRNAAFQAGIPERELAESDVVIGFDTSSWLLAERALALGRRFILDRSIGHPLSFERLAPALRQRFPEWVEDFPPRLPSLLRAEEAEHRLADRIVVPSSFTRETLIENGTPAHKITVIPFGVDLSAFRPFPRSNTSRPVRFIFLGALGVRKGVPVLLEAWRSVARLGAELWLAGSVSEKHARLIPALKGLKQIGKVPHKDLPAVLSQCDVLVFPSYFEGLAQVQLEALAGGLPIIATEASGATDLIVDGKEGYIIPVGDSGALAEAMLNFIKSPEDLATMSAAARLCAERYSWEAYGDRWIDLLCQVH